MIGDTGRAAERRLLARLGAIPTKASGALADKGDGVRGVYRIEVKSTVAGSMGIKLGWLQKIAREALQTAKRPALAVVFCTEDGRDRQDGEWVMVRAQDWKELTDALDSED